MTHKITITHVFRIDRDSRYGDSYEGHYNLSCSCGWKHQAGHKPTVGTNGSVLFDRDSPIFEHQFELMLKKLELKFVATEAPDQYPDGKLPKE